MDQKEFKEHLSEAFENHLVQKLQSENEHSAFPYEKLAGKPDADNNGFIQEYPQPVSFTSLFEDFCLSRFSNGFF